MGGNNVTVYPQDARSGSIKIIDIGHSKLHDGLMFQSGFSVSVGTGTVASVLISAPATGVYHLAFDIEATNSGTWTFSEAPNASGGTAIVTVNKNRLSANTNTLTHTHTPTYVSSGTVLTVGAIGTAGIGNANAGGNGGERDEWILNASTLYLLRFTALNAATNVVIKTSAYRQE